MWRLLSRSNTCFSSRSRSSTGNHQCRCVIFCFAASVVLRQQASPSIFLLTDVIACWFQRCRVFHLSCGSRLCTSNSIQGSIRSLSRSFCFCFFFLSLPQCFFLIVSFFPPPLSLHFCLFSCFCFDFSLSSIERSIGTSSEASPPPPILTYSSRAFPNLCSYSLTSHSQRAIASVFVRQRQTIYRCSRCCMRIHWRLLLLQSRVAFNLRQAPNPLLTCFFTVTRALSARCTCQSEVQLMIVGFKVLCFS